MALLKSWVWKTPVLLPYRLSAAFKAASHVLSKRDLWAEEGPVSICFWISLVSILGASEGNFLQVTPHDLAGDYVVLVFVDPTSPAAARESLTRLQDVTSQAGACT